MQIGIDYVGVTTPFYCNDGQGNFLFHRRSKNTRDEHDTWDTGSGKLEFGMELHENVLKEVKEEYGCEGVIQGLIPAHSIIREFGGKRSHWIAIPHFVLIKKTQARNNEPFKIDEIGWFKLDALPVPLHSGFKYTLLHFPEYFEQYR